MKTNGVFVICNSKHMQQQTQCPCWGVLGQTLQVNLDKNLQAGMNKRRDTAEQMVAVRSQSLRPQWPVCFADATPEPVNTDRPPSKKKKQTPNGLVTRLTPPQPSDLLSPAVTVIINLHVVTSRKDTFPTFYSLSNFPPIQGCSSGACQLLPPQSFINIVSLFIQREQGSATMTTDASDCRPPISTSDTCVWGIFFKKGSFCL